MTVFHWHGWYFEKNKTYMNLRSFLRLFILMLVALQAGCSNPATMDWHKIDVIDLDGKSIEMSSYEGQRIVLNFWATWCGPCIAEMPSMEIARQELEGEGYVFLLLSDEPHERIREFKDTRDFDFEFLRMIDPLKSQGIFSIPQTYIIDREGNIVRAITGGINWASEESLAFLKSVQ